MAAAAVGVLVMPESAWPLAAVLSAALVVALAVLATTREERAAFLARVRAALAR